MKRYLEYFEMCINKKIFQEVLSTLFLKSAIQWYF